MYGQTICLKEGDFFPSRIAAIQLVGEPLWPNCSAVGHGNNASMRADEGLSAHRTFSRIGRLSEAWRRKRYPAFAQVFDPTLVK
jgi:hypothetical protein